MRVHHVNCGTMCPSARRLVNGEGSLFARGRMVCHCLLVETDRELVLVDTGIGTADIANPRGRLGAMFTFMTHPTFSPEETALAHVERLGFKKADVRHIAPTHLDLDHAGGLSDFPDATVHVFHAEQTAALAPKTSNERSRYRAPQWAHGPKWQTHDIGGDSWFGFDSVRAIPRTDGEVLIVPLVGHTRGHAAIAVKTRDGWLLHAGDAYFFHGEIDATPPHCPGGLSFFQRLVAIDNEARVKNQARLRELARDHANEVKVFSAHCPVEFERFTSTEVAAAKANGVAPSPGVTAS
jgi:glyoxylase-like metal-dependent hydrolase (beta-lactamase superfamily II)